jgi:hypothetical protein
MLPLDETVENFRTHGWMRVRGAFTSAGADAMREAIWRVLEAQGIHRDNRSTWTKERPEHLQQLKADPVFRAAGSSRMLAAVDEILDGQAYAPPKNWGAFFIAFPTARPWGVPRSGWHCDANYLSSLRPPAGVRIHSLLGDVDPRGGGTLLLSGSHRLIHDFFRSHPEATIKGSVAREALKRHPYIRDLHDMEGREARIARFLGAAEEIDGIPLQVIENTGRAGDAMLLHPLLMHVAAANNSESPRFLMSGGMDTDAMWSAVVAEATAS